MWGVTQTTTTTTTSGDSGVDVHLQAPSILSFESVVRRLADAGACARADVGLPLPGTEVLVPAALEGDVAALLRADGLPEDLFARPPAHLPRWGCLPGAHVKDFFRSFYLCFVARPAHRAWSLL